MADTMQPMQPRDCSPGSGEIVTCNLQWSATVGQRAPATWPGSAGPHGHGHTRCPGPDIGRCQRGLHSAWTLWKYSPGAKPRSTLSPVNFLTRTTALLWLRLQLRISQESTFT